MTELKWEKVYAGWYQFEDEVKGIYYTITQIGTKKWGLCIIQNPDVKTDKEFPTLRAAQAAAEKDYKERSREN